jgi:CRISPR-associated protein Csm4
LKGDSLASLYPKARTLQNKKLLVGENDFKSLPAELQKTDAKVWDLEQRPRVTLDRASSASNLFHIGQVHFAEACGLWFAVRWLKADEDLKKQFKNMLEQLAATGFGAERGVGLGIAQVKQSGALDLPDANGAWVTLSRYLPKEDEVAALGDARSAYSLKSVGGWLDSPTNMGQRRIPLNLIEEGSVIGIKAAHEVPGRVEDVQPCYKVDEEEVKPLGHPVWRCGLALAVGMEGGAG